MAGASERMKRPWPGLCVDIDAVPQAALGLGRRRGNLLKHLDHVASLLFGLIIGLLQHDDTRLRRGLRC